MLIAWDGPGPGLGQGLPASPWAGPKASPPVPGLAKTHQNVGSGQNRQKRPESDPESTVRAENRSRSMPGQLQSVSDRSRDQKKVKKSAQAAPGLTRRVKRDSVASAWTCWRSLSRRSASCTQCHGFPRNINGWLELVKPVKGHAGQLKWN